MATAYANEKKGSVGKLSKGRAQGSKVPAGKKKGVAAKGRSGAKTAELKYKKYEIYSDGEQTYDDTLKNDDGLAATAKSIDEQTFSDDAKENAERKAKGKGYGTTKTLNYVDKKPGSQECATGKKAVMYGSQFIGNPYVWGGKGEVISKPEMNRLTGMHGTKETDKFGCKTWAERYRWLLANHSGKRGFDCSGFSCCSYGEGVGHDISEGSGWRPCEAKAIWVHQGQPDVKELKIGDVIVSPGHYQLYYGNGLAIESCDSKGVTNTLAWNHNGVYAVYRYFDD